MICSDCSDTSMLDLDNNFLFGGMLISTNNTTTTITISSSSSSSTSDPASMCPPRAMSEADVIMWLTDGNICTRDTDGLLCTLPILVPAPPFLVTALPFVTAALPFMVTVL